MHSETFIKPVALASARNLGAVFFDSNLFFFVISSHTSQYPVSVAYVRVFRRIHTIFDHISLPTFNTIIYNADHINAFGLRGLSIGPET